MNDKLRKLIRVVIILIGIGILVYPSISEFLQQQNASRAVSSYDDTVSKTEQARLDAMLRDAREYNKLLVSSTGIKNHPVDVNGNPITLKSYDSLLNINGDGMIGYISIPKLNTTDRIFHGTKEDVLQVGIGHLKNTSLPVGGKSTHAVLSGHRGLPSADLFTDLDQLKNGDEFYIKVLNKTFRYTIDQILTVLPNETEELNIKNDKDYVTLVTCTPYGVNSHRLLVRGKRAPYDDSKGIPVYDNRNLQSFWSRLPVQYRHMLIGACAIIVFVIIWIIVRFIIKKVKQSKQSEISDES